MSYRWFQWSLRCLGLASLGALGVACGGSYDDSSESEALGTQQQAVHHTSRVIVNQLGFVKGRKMAASVTGSDCNSKAWAIKLNGTAVTGTGCSGTTPARKQDTGSGEYVCRVDFTQCSSSLSTANTYTLDVTGVGVSDGFKVYDSASGLYPLALFQDSVYYFTWHRLGSQTVNITLNTTNWGGTRQGGEMTAAPTVTRNHKARPDDFRLTDYQGKLGNIVMDVDCGHMDAGDFGKYNDNAIQAMWILGNAIELINPATTFSQFPDTDKKLVSEVICGLKYMKGTLPPGSSYLAAHKCHDDAWDPDQPWGNGTPYNPTGPATSTSAVATGNLSRRHCVGGSSTSTYAVARGLAQLARIATVDSTYWTTAKNAWTRVQNLAPAATDGVWNEAKWTAESPGFAIGGGPYNDPWNYDDRFAAAVELYLTAKAKGESYTTYLNVINSTQTDCRHNGRPTGTAARCLGLVKRRYFDWEADAPAGNLSLMGYHLKSGGTCSATACSGGLQSDINMKIVRDAIVAEANDAESTINNNGFPTPINTGDGGYPWGSNKVVLHTAMIAAYAHKLTNDGKYLDVMLRSLDHLFGDNYQRMSMVTGYGNHSVMTIHDRQAWNRAPKGWVAGGPLNWTEVNDYYPWITGSAGDFQGGGCKNGGEPACAVQDGSNQPGCCSMVATPRDQNYPARNMSTRWEDFDWSWCSREVTIDWNAPLVWTLAYLRGLSGTCTPNSCPANSCGTMPDGCGTNLNCGTCSSGYTCTSNQCVANTGGTDPVATYALEANANDGSGNAKHGTLMNSPTFVTGRVGNAINLAGGAAGSASQHVQLPNGIVSACTDLTVASWVNLNSNSTNWTRIFDFGSGTGTNMFLSPRAGGTTLRFAIKVNGSAEQQISYAYTFPTATWKHVAVTLTGTTGRLYLDGVEVASNTSMTFNPNEMGVTNQNWLGKSQWNDPFLAGKLDEVVISCRAFSASEIATLASAGTCQPNSCPANSCGSMPDGCGSNLNCGTCSSGYTCTNNQCVANTGGSSVYLEAECGTTKVGAYATMVTTEAGYSGNGHIRSVGNTTAASYDGTSTDRATYTVNVSAGTYKIYFRVDTNASGTDDSWFYRVDNGTWAMNNNHTASSAWQWIAGAGGNITLSAGNHTIEIANREDGLAIDKIALLPSTDAAPSGSGGTAETCGTSGGSANGTACSLGSQCTSGNCVDGVCCNTACGGGSSNDCVACNISGYVGTCTNRANNSTCNDGDANTCNDICTSGTCGGGTCGGGGGLGCTTSNSTAIAVGTEHDFVAGNCYSFSKASGVFKFGNWSGITFTANVQDSTGTAFNPTVPSGNWYDVSGVANGTGFFKTSVNVRAMWNAW